MILSLVKKEKKANISRILSQIPSRLSQSILAKSKFFRNKNLTSNFQLNKTSYIQVLQNNIKDIIKIKDAFPKLSADKICKVQRVINNLSYKNKPRLNITIKDPLKKQVIISMKAKNSDRVMAKANTYISSIYRLLKEVKSEISIDFIQSDNKGLLITTNKVTTVSNLKIIEKYIKNLNNIDSDNVISFRLSQSKSYLKILSISYFVKNTNLSLFFDITKI